MTITNEQADQIKQQLTQQIQSSNEIPQEQKQQLTQQIQSMSQEQLIDFLKQNNIIKNESDLQNLYSNQAQNSECVFCNIINKKIPSTILKENQEAIAILELNPISKAHTLIIPKEHISSADKIPKQMTDLTNEINNLIKQKLSPKNTLIDINSIMGHIVTNIIPVYNNETLDSQRNKTTPQELEKIKQQILKKEIKKDLNKDCIFCSIISNKTSSYKIDENKDSIAILELNPISKAHTLVIPKKHIQDSEQIPLTAFTLAKKISKKIKTKFSPKQVIINTSKEFKHQIINIIPVYNNETIESQRNKTTSQELEKIQKALKPKKTNKKNTSNKKQKSSIKLPQRIP